MEDERISISVDQHEEEEPLIAAEKPNRQAIIQVGGMTCSNCSGAVERALNQLPAVERCQVDLINEKACVTYRCLPADKSADEIEGDFTTAKELCEEIEDIGFEASLIEDLEVNPAEKARARATLHVSIMEDGRQDDLASIKEMTKIRGVLEVIPQDSDQVRLDYNPFEVGARDLLAAVRAKGYKAKTEEASGKAEASFWDTIPTGLPTAVLLTMSIVLVAEVLPCFHHCKKFLHKEILPGLSCLTLVLCVLATPVQLYCGWRFHAGAYHSIRSGVWDMNLLISLGTAICFSYSLVIVLLKIASTHVVGYNMECKGPPVSYFESPCLVITFILVGKYLEAWAKSGASQSLRNLMELKPAQAHLLLDGDLDRPSAQSEHIPLELLQIGDVVQVFPGDKAPADGIMSSKSGSAEFDESLLTGESRPVTKKPGDVIIGGSTCISGRVELRVEKLGSSTMLSQITSLVQHAQLSRAPVQQVADFVAQMFVPGIVMLALLTWTVWYILVYVLDKVPMSTILHGQNSHWPELDRAFFVLEHGLTVLLVACPCALGLATPTAVMAATGVAAKNGILVRSGAVPLELGSKVKKIVLDKTGTLTTGKPQVVGMVAIAPRPSDEAEPGWKELLAAFRQACHNKTGRRIAFATEHVTTWIANFAEKPKVEKPKVLREDSPESGSDGSTTASETASDESSSRKLRLSLPGSRAKDSERKRDEAEQALWWALGSAELSSEHPLAKEVVAVSEDKARCPLIKPESFENVTGVGLLATLPGGLKVEVASAGHILQKGEGKYPADLKEWVEINKTRGATVIAIAVQDVPLGCVAMRDKLAPNARACVAHLEMQGIEVWMCSGDHQQAAEMVARECGIDSSRVVAEALPSDKVKTVKRLQDESTVVAMVGDGVNDAPALAAADLGVAIGAGQNVMVDAADIVLVRSDLQDLLAFFDLSKQTLRTIWFNFTWAFAFNLCALPVAAGAFWKYDVMMTPQIACTLMLGSSLFVVMTSLLLKNYKRPELPCHV
mmetsp:Transcript_34499/g.62537  ORF Transcript_34499/g.62537 Transcript_34499/m.62537 type:complete len:1012 (+) Transcript_34499:100-3135(+)|eukprot:CAMPEP_0197652396 /NCGR_PEP_ID=MMETSP1338-20131121/34424_1 /TAXON_ID=43686 ORGANISM="Pelagodinium beii, Strain RCC1491" /NCGR_SAMPLE_ID=MMETSP1338 /ASSEMBLY_ACC=CAM_ASM_000754 /LENGTH=1011 /DNA_ID=CAMNT_0043227267 /DNA_START=66 /DNA_END=3101 /DNA_ORIENTATION=+